jgi:hypothetical protein
VDAYPLVEPVPMVVGRLEAEAEAELEAKAEAAAALILFRRRFSP